jgi:hypothetical protein
MIIQINTDGQVEFLDRDNFKAFKITAPATHASVAALGTALTGIAQVADDGKTAWVSQDALRAWGGQAQPAEWIAAFDRMIESVKRFGWIDEAAGTVRGHIEVV